MNSPSSAVIRPQTARAPAARPTTQSPVSFGSDAIRRNIATGSIRMVFQPVVDIRTGHIRGAEALARFDTEPYRTPDVWFAEAEACGLGVELECLAVQAALSKLDEIDEDLYLAVNVSPRTLLSAELREVIARVPGPRVVLELTEHAKVNDYAELQAMVAFFRSRGVRLAIDDAGSGFASFQHILELRPDLIKLDRTLTTDVDSNPVKYALASALVTFAASLGARICAEGVETAAELVALQRLGVHKAQGYYLAKPGPLPLQSPPRGIWFAPPTTAAIEPGAAPYASPAVKSRSRLAALRASNLWDSPPEEEFDRFTRLATRLLKAPVALLSLVDDRRQFFKSAAGLDVRETPLSHSFCAHVVTGRTPLVVDDSTANPIVAGNPVIEQLGVASYAGVPVMTADGEALGSFCAVDSKPRKWTPDEVEMLQDIADAASDQIELRTLARTYRSDASVLNELLDTLDVGVMLLDLDLTIVRVNSALSTLLMHSVEELTDKPLAVIKPAEDLVQSFVGRDELLSGRTAHVKGRLRFVRKDREEIWLTIRATVVRDEHGVPQQILVTLHG